MALGKIGKLVLVDTYCIIESHPLVFSRNPSLLHTFVAWGVSTGGALLGTLPPWQVS